MPTLSSIMLPKVVTPTVPAVAVAGKFITPVPMTQAQISATLASYAAQNDAPGGIGSITTTTLGSPAKPNFMTGTFGVGTFGVPVGAAATVSFSATAPGELSLQTPSTFQALIKNFGIHDDILLTGFHATGMSYANGRLTLADAAHNTDTLAFSGNYKASDFTLSSIAGGSVVTFQNSTPFSGILQHH